MTTKGTLTEGGETAVMGSRLEANAFSFDMSNETSKEGRNDACSTRRSAKRMVNGEREIREEK
jgi:hypothetical protein